MKKSAEIIFLGALGLGCLLPQGCATQSGAVGGDEFAEELIDEPMIKHIPPPEYGGLLASRPRSSARAELSAVNATGLPPGALSDVLFDFDQAVLRRDALPILEANAERLDHDGVRRLTLEGRGDEAGTAAYNLVLGERRAKSVKAYLQELGLGLQFKTTSYGKDRPLCYQHSEGCMQKNRSVHFVVKE
ncbi:MAG TPA: OmpA family protein [Nitrospira sp.]|jgi:peptidoglycan-associated lipoprotein|nr:OmpA family protein [Nitrospira sp.]